MSAPPAGPWRGPTPALRRRRRRRHERLRPRGARARGGASAALTPRPARTCSAGTPTACCRRASGTTPRTSPPATTSSCSTPRRSPRTTSSARAARERGLRERPRAELLGELSALRRTIAVAGTHGKTTTAAMLVARAARGRPAIPAGWSGGDRRRPAECAAWSDGEWLVVEADESDRSMLSLERRDRRADERRARPPRDVRVAGETARGVRRASPRSPRGAIVVWDRPELLALLPDGPAEVARFDVAAPALMPAARAFAGAARQVRLAVPGAHNALNAQRRPGSGTPGRRRRRRARSAGCPRFARRRAALSAARAQPRRRARVRRLRAPPDRGGGDAATRRARSRRGAWSPSSSRTCTRARAAARREFGRALARADVVVVLDVYPARERAADHPGVSGLLIAEAAADAARAGRSTGCRRSTTPRAVLRWPARRRRRVPGDGRRRRRRARRASWSSGGRRERRRGRAAPPDAGCERDYPIARLSTVTTGGDAEFFARAGSEAELARAAALGRRRRASP